MLPVVRLDTDHPPTPADTDGIFGVSKIFASAHFSPEVAGINRDGRSHGRGHAA